MFHQSRGSGGTNQMIQKLIQLGSVTATRSRWRCRRPQWRTRPVDCRRTHFGRDTGDTDGWELPIFQTAVSGTAVNEIWGKIIEVSMEVLMEKSSTENIFQGFLLGLHGFSSKNPWLGKFMVDFPAELMTPEGIFVLNARTGLAGNRLSCWMESRIMMDKM